MKRITLLTGLIAGAMTLQAAPREPQQMTATLQKGAVVVTNGKARFTFRADFRLFRTDKINSAAECEDSAALLYKQHIL